MSLSSRSPTFTASIAWVSTVKLWYSFSIAGRQASMFLRTSSRETTVVWRTSSGGVSPTVNPHNRSTQRFRQPWVSFNNRSTSDLRLVSSWISIPYQARSQFPTGTWFSVSSNTSETLPCSWTNIDSNLSDSIFRVPLSIPNPLAHTCDPPSPSPKVSSNNFSTSSLIPSTSTSSPPVASAGLMEGEYSSNLSASGGMLTLGMGGWPGNDFPIQPVWWNWGCITFIHTGWIRP